MRHSPKRMVARLAARAIAVVSVLSLTVVMTACASAKHAVVASDQLPSDASSVVTVMVIDNKYEPAQVEIEVGQAVRWVFAGVMEHDVVAADGSFVSDLVTEGEYVRVFTEAGEFPYDCSVHPEMTGQVTVR